VEPGVGRACLIHFVHLLDRPDLLDFTMLGVGLTPYSADGFVDVGRTIDGKAALVRAVHRQACANMLEDAGCRAGKVAAILELEGDGVEMLDGSRSPAALVLRGFRSVLRVRQVDPVASFYNSTRYSSLVAPFVLDPMWESTYWRGSAAAKDSRQLEAALSEFGAAPDDLYRLYVHDAPDPTPFHREARCRRRAILAAYLPLLLAEIRRRVTHELGRDPLAETITKFEYVEWFARELGRQMALMRRARFLHDYHHPGVSRYSRDWVYTLVPHNVSLMAEFPDLDTAVFVDDNDCIDRLQLARADAATLRRSYAFFRRRDVLATRTVVHVLAAAALDSRAEIRHCLRAFEQLAEW
jgi:hypothetical protein